MVVGKIERKGDLEKIQTDESKKYLLFFWAAWHEPSQLGGQMHGVVDALSKKFPNIDFFTVEAEGVPDVSESLEIIVVPTFIAMIGKKIQKRIEGANPNDLLSVVNSLNDFKVSADVPAVESKVEINKKLEIITKSAPVMLFMKGTPSHPRCGFSRQLVEILTNNEIPFASFDILTSDELRAGLKVYSDWPTFPQLYVNGEFMGGLDIVKEIAASGNIKQQLGVQELLLPPPPQPIEARLKNLINQSPVMIFIKGTSTEPRCGFSKSLIALLNESGVDFSYFDILTDEEVRSGLKVYSDWPTYPQMYVRGELIGGLDIVKEMTSSGDLKKQLNI